MGIVKVVQTRRRVRCAGQRKMLIREMNCSTPRESVQGWRRRCLSVTGLDRP